MGELLLGTAIFTAGYSLGRYQPVQRASNWANRHRFESTLRRKSWCRRAAWLVLSMENIAWISVHPQKAIHAWKHRNDPLPQPEAAPEISKINT